MTPQEIRDKFMKQTLESRKIISNSLIEIKTKLTAINT